nr:ST.21 [Starmerella bombicola]
MAADVSESSMKSPQAIGFVQFPSIPSTANSSGHTSTHRWTPRRGSGARFGHGRNRSRAKSFSEQTQDAVKVVAPPISVTLVLLCIVWYCSSAVSNNLSKGILQIFEYPVSLTMIQFVYTALFSSLAGWWAKKNPSFSSLFPKNTMTSSGLIGPGSFVLRSTAPMAGFQIIGHILSHSATSQIPVSLVHAIKSLSPLLTVAVYTFVFRARYNLSTYISLIPLTVGVMMACAAEFRAKPLALFYAFMSCVVFVSQNIWSKSLLTTGDSVENQEDLLSTAPTRKLDKLTIIFWCAVLGFAGTLPIWLLSDGVKAMRYDFELHNGGTFSQLFFLCTLNGFSHFCQNLLSFMILGTISTVTYSIASLLKRVFVMSAAILWFGQKITVAQGWGICITFVGLYMYDRFGSKASYDHNASAHSRRDQARLPK